MKPFVLLMISGLLTGGVLTAGKLAGTGQIPPMTLLLWQVSGGALMLWLASLSSGLLPRWNRSAVRYYLVGGLLSVSLPFALAFVVLREIPVGLLGMISALSPLMTYGLSNIFASETGSRRQLLGLFVGLLGVVLIMLPKGADPVSASWPYLVLALCIPLSLAGGNIFRSVAWPAGGAPMSLATGMLTMQSLWLLPATLIFDQFQLPGVAHGDSGLLGIALALMAGGSYLSSLALLRIGGPVYLSQIGYVVTAVTVVFGATLLGERYGVRDWITIGLIFIGILMSGRPTKRLAMTDTARIEQGPNVSRRCLAECDG